MRSKNEVSQAPTMEELKAIPSYKEVKLRPLTQKSEEPAP